MNKSFPTVVHISSHCYLLFVNIHEFISPNFGVMTVLSTTILMVLKERALDAYRWAVFLFYLGVRANSINPVCFLF